jgi:hypothetical protein
MAMLKTLSENLALLALLVVLVGLSSTESYYSYFGLSYQFLNLPSDHFAYRGMTAVFGSYLIVLIYLLAVFLVAMQSRLAFWLGRPRRLNALNHALIVLFAFTAWWAGRYAGERAAIRDATTGSTLPLLAHLDIKSKPNASFTAVDGLRLLLRSREGLYVIKPVANARNETTLVKFIASEQLEGFELCAHC